MLCLSVSSAQPPSSAQTHADLTSFNNWERSCAFAGVNLDARVLPRTFKDTDFWSNSSYGLLQVHLLGHDGGGDGSWVTCMMSLRASTGQESSTQANLQTGCVVSSGGSPAIFSLLPHTLPPPSTCLASCPPLAHFSSVSHTAGIQRLKHFSSMKETAPSSLTPPLVDKTQAQPALESA